MAVFQSFDGKDINETNTPAGQRFSYTYIPGEDVNTGPDLTHVDARGILNPEIKNSYLQIRTDSAAMIVIDKLTIETVATDVPDVEPPVEPPIDLPVEGEIPTVELPFTTDFTALTADISLLIIKKLLMLTAMKTDVWKTAGSVTVIDTGLELDGGRFTLGNTTPGIEAAAHTTTSGALDLSRPYQVVMDIVSVSDPEGDNKFQIYVDNTDQAALNQSMVMVSLL